VIDSRATANAAAAADAHGNRSVGDSQGELEALFPFQGEVAILMRGNKEDPIILDDDEHCEESGSSVFHGLDLPGKSKQVSIDRDPTVCPTSISTSPLLSPHVIIGTDGSSNGKVSETILVSRGELRAPL
jgi:hypothetical protein